MRIFETKFLEEDLVDINKTLMSGLIGYGLKSSELEEKFSSFSKKQYNVSVNSASAAAFIIFAYLKNKYGCCDVYTPSIGFTSPAWAAKHHGHNLIFVDVDENMLMSMESYTEERRFRCERYSDCGVKPVLMPVLYGGVSFIPDLEKVVKQDGYNEFVILDSAHCSTPTNICDVSFFSFHPYKPIASSDGGMISTNIIDLENFSKMYKNFGRENNKNGYEITSEGFKFYMNDLNASIALTQIERYKQNLDVRKQNFNNIQSKGLNGRLLPHDSNSSYYIATLICKTRGEAEEYRSVFCKDRLYPPLHKQSFYKQKYIHDLKNTDSFYNRMVNIPLYKNL